MSAETAAEPQKPNNLVGLAVLLAFVGFGAALALGAPVGPATFAFVFCGWILAVMAHEFAHAAVGWLAGDKTVAKKGYLSFDPRRYGDVGTSLVLPLIALALGGIGLPGGAVWLRHDLMRGPIWRAAASLAGPAGTLVVLLALSLVLALWSRVALPGPLFEAVALLALLQAMALILNLLPLPGLDGFGAIRPFLPRRWLPAVQKAEGLSLVALLLLIFFVPGFSALIFGSSAGLAETLGAPRAAMGRGFDAFQFWR